MSVLSQMDQNKLPETPNTGSTAQAEPRALALAAGTIKLELKTNPESDGDEDASSRHRNSTGHGVRRGREGVEGCYSAGKAETKRL